MVTRIVNNVGLFRSSAGDPVRVMVGTLVSFGSFRIAPLTKRGNFGRKNLVGDTKVAGSNGHLDLDHHCQSDDNVSMHGIEGFEKVQPNQVNVSICRK